jgi:hypothetical protein
VPRLSYPSAKVNDGSVRWCGFSIDPFKQRWSPVLDLLTRVRLVMLPEGNRATKLYKRMATLVFDF